MTAVTTMAKAARRWIVPVGLAVAACLADDARAESARGVWMTEGGKSHVRIQPCGEKLCGEIVWLKEPRDDDGSEKRDVHNKDESLRDRPILGLPLLTGFSDQGGGEWTGGEIYNPEDGKTYRSRLELADPATLKVSGCVLFFCKTQTWTRTE